MKSYARRLVALLTCVSVAPVAAQVTIPQEYDKTIKSAQVVGALGNDLFGDQTNFYTGATSFSVTDVSLPGNSALPVAIGRRFVVRSRDSSEQFDLLDREGMFQDWDLEIPHLHGVFASNDGWIVRNSSGPETNRCSASGFFLQPPGATGSFSGVWNPTEFWHGYNLYVPGSGDQELLIANASKPQPTDGNSYVWVTKENWYFSCMPSLQNGLPGEGFLAIDPSGNRYEFDWMVQQAAPVIVKDKGTIEVLSGEESSATTLAPVGDKTSLSRVEVWILPTQVTDRFGNYVTYTYDSAHPWRLMRIAANDGRQLDLTYNANGHIETVSNGTRSWHYTYNNGLSHVTLPDDSQWEINLASVRSAFTTPRSDQEDRLCENRGSSTTQSIYTGTITHPSGAVGEFKFQSKLHGRSYVPKSCLKPDPNGAADYAHKPYLFDAVGLIQKRVTGPGIPAMQWTYSYGQPNNSWAEDCSGDSCVATKTVEVDGPDAYRRYTFGNKYMATDGMLLKVETGSSPTAILKTETTVYELDPTGQLYLPQVGRSPDARGDGMAEDLRPIVQRQVVQQGWTFEWRVEDDCGTGTAWCFDQSGRPLKVTKESAAAP